jgi:hypothetical protein
MTSKLTPHAESPEISGLLYKKRGGFGKMMPNSWQYRLFILSRDGVLTYYDTEVPDNKDIFDNKERGRIDLKGVRFELLTDTGEGAPTPHALTIQPEDSEKWRLCADTKEDHTRWWKAIEKFIQDRADRNTAIAQLTIQSDDDTESPTGGSKNRFSRAGDGSLSKSNTPMNNQPAPATFSSDTASSPLPVPTKALQQALASPSTAPATKKGKGLKLQKEAGMVSQDVMEWGLVMIIVNICLYGVLRSGSSPSDKLIYIAALNIVVGHSLFLRARRAARSNSGSIATVNVTPAHAPGLEPMSGTGATLPKRPSFTPASGSSARPAAHALTASALSAPVVVDYGDSVSAGRALLMQGKKPVAGTIPARILDFCTAGHCVYDGLLCVG